MTSLVRNPGFEDVVRDGDPYLFHPVEGTLVKLDARVARALEPGAADTSALEGLRLLVPEELAALLARGVATRSTTPLGPSWHRARPVAGWVAVGCPVSWHSLPLADPAAGTALVRTALARRINGSGPTYWSWGAGRHIPRDALIAADYGDLIHDPSIDSAADSQERLRFAVRQVLADGARPLVLGGDHSVAYPTVSAVLDHHQNTRVVHLDAHADRAPIRRERPPHCGNFLSHLLDNYPNLEVLTIGVRGSDSGFPHDSGEKVAYLRAEDVGTRAANERIRAFVAHRTVHLTIDVDVVDPSEAPEVAYPVPGGPTMAQVAGLVRHVASCASIVGMDLSEVCPAPGLPNRAATCLAQLATDILEGTLEF